MLCRRRRIRTLPKRALIEPNPANADGRQGLAECLREAMVAKPPDLVVGRHWSPGQHLVVTSNRATLGVDRSSDGEVSVSDKPIDVPSRSETYPGADSEYEQRSGHRRASSHAREVRRAQS